MQTLATAPGVVSTPGKYYCGAEDVMNYLGCKENKAYDLIRQLREVGKWRRTQEKTGSGRLQLRTGAGRCK